MARLLLRSEVKITATKTRFTAGCLPRCCHIVAQAPPSLHAVRHVYPMSPIYGRNRRGEGPALYVEQQQVPLKAKSGGPVGHAIFPHGSEPSLSPATLAFRVR